KRIHPHDTQRIQRALAVHHLSGKPLSQLQKNTGLKLPYHLQNIAILPADRAQLREAIRNRFERMLAQGFVEEVERLYQTGQLQPDLPASRAVCYRQVTAYLAGKIDYEMMRNQSVVATYQLAKRQMT